MEAKENDRLKELKLSFYISEIDNINNKLSYSRIMRLLSCLAGALGNEAHSAYTKLSLASVNNNLLEATDKEIVATIQTFFSKRRAASLLGMSNTSIYNKYGHLLTKECNNEEYLKGLTPKFAEPYEKLMIETMTSFIENFKFDIGNDDIPLRDNERTLEIEFWLIYDKIMSILQNAMVCDKFLFNICNVFDIDYKDVAQLKNNIHIITRRYPNFKYGNRYFMQEVVYLYHKKGLSKCQIATKVLNKDNNFFYIGTNKKYTQLIGSDDASWMYAPTLDWGIINKASIMKFVHLFHEFINYDL